MGPPVQRRGFRLPPCTRAELVRRATGPRPGRIGKKVKVTVKVERKDLDQLNLLVEKEADDNWTWSDFFRNHTSTHIELDPQKFHVKSGQGTTFLLTQKIRELTKEYKTRQTVYCVQVTKKMTAQSTPRHPNGNGAASGQQNVTGPLATPVSQSQSRQPLLGSQGQAVKNAIKRKRSNTVGLLDRDTDIETSTDYYRSTSSSEEEEDEEPRRKRRPAHQKLKEAPVRSSPLNDDVEGPNVLESTIGGASGAVEPELNDDNASHLSTASRASRYDLAADENLKADVLKKLAAADISNDTLLVMKNELRKLDTKFWMAFSKRAPTNATILTALLLK